MLTYSLNMNEGNYSEDCCVISKKGFEKENSVAVSRKGALTLVKFRVKNMGG